jgi:uncharacterized protein YkwD
MLGSRLSALRSLRAVVRPLGRRQVFAMLGAAIIGVAATACTPAAAPAPQAPAWWQQPVPAGWQNQMLAQVNAWRALHGDGPVVMCPRLQTAAETLTNDEAAHNFIGHVGSDGSTTLERVSATGYLSLPYAWGIGENTAGGQVDVTQVMSGWEASPGHNANLLNPAMTGAGFAEATTAAGPYHRFWSQDFGYGGVC